MSFDLTANVEQRHEMFVRRVVDQQVVWGLQVEEGWGSAVSNDVPGTPVIPFWSDRAYAERCATEGWAEYEPASVTFYEFISRLVPELCDYELRVGTNWNIDREGRESEPVDLASELHNTYVERVARPFVETVVDQDTIWVFADDEQISNLSFDPYERIYPVFTDSEAAVAVYDQTMPPGYTKRLELEEFLRFVETLDADEDCIALDWEVENLGWYLSPPAFVELVEEFV